MQQIYQLGLLDTKYLVLHICTAVVFCSGVQQNVYRAQAKLLKDGPAHSELCPVSSVSNQEKASQASLLTTIPHLSAPQSKSPCCLKLAVEANYDVIILLRNKYIKPVHQIRFIFIPTYYLFYSYQFCLKCACFSLFS